MSHFHFHTFTFTLSLWYFHTSTLTLVWGSAEGSNKWFGSSANKVLFLPSLLSQHFWLSPPLPPFNPGFQDQIEEGMFVKQKWKGWQRQCVNIKYGSYQNWLSNIPEWGDWDLATSFRVGLVTQLIKVWGLCLCLFTWRYPLYDIHSGCNGAGQWTNDVAIMGEKSAHIIAVSPLMARLVMGPRVFSSSQLCGHMLCMAGLWRNSIWQIFHHMLLKVETVSTLIYFD